MRRTLPFIGRLSGVAGERGRLSPTCPLVYLSWPYPAMLQALEFFLIINFRGLLGDGKGKPAPQGRNEAREIRKQRGPLFLETLHGMVKTPFPRERRDPGDREYPGRFQAAPPFWPAAPGEVSTGKRPAALLNLSEGTEDRKGSPPPPVPIWARGMETPPLVLPKTLLAEGPRPQPREAEKLANGSRPARLPDVPGLRSASGREESPRQGPVPQSPEKERAYSLVHPGRIAPGKRDRINIAPLAMSTATSIGDVPSTTEPVPALSYLRRAETGPPLGGRASPHRAESIPAAGYPAGTSLPPASLEHLVPGGAAAPGPLQGKSLAGDLKLDHPKDLLESPRKSPLAQINLGSLADEVYRLIERKIRIERERRGVLS